MSNDDEELSGQMKHDRLRVRITHFNAAAVHEGGETAFFTDTVKCTAALPVEELEELLHDMGIEDAGFVKNLPEEITSIPLKRCKYVNHEVTFWHSTKKVCSIESATLFGFTLFCLDNGTFNLVFSLKGTPSSENHRLLEAAVLDAKTGQLHALSVNTPKQLELVDDGEEG